MTTPDLDLIEKTASDASYSLNACDKSWPSERDEAFEFGGDLNSHDAEYLIAMSPDVAHALVAEVRKLRTELAMLRDADRDATGRFAASEHLDAKWHPKIRQFMRERDTTQAELKETREALAETRRALRKTRTKINAVREIHKPETIGVNYELRKFCPTCHIEDVYGHDEDELIQAEWPCPTIKALGEEA